MIYVHLRDIEREIRARKTSLECTVFNLKLDDDTEHLVTPRQLQIHPLSDAPISLNFLKWNPKIRMRIPLKYINADQSVDLRRGCFLMPINKYVECLCAYEPPQHIIVDLNGTIKNQVIRLSNVKLPPGVVACKNKIEDIPLVKITSSSG
eukprot:CAMPEP_0119043050 /NCGR_PEP_ID=MMETSP1177-20130426/16950_1 /TAXON_ID=2985 /ORGANISM="Ochromonas sp, Strain CCMP1899" /LENGTH=149 /DNA_ID=CAMNT_0007010291 /DNA_START=306 /DNA_END=758 /DNA_ORIENTATION=+